MFLRVRNSRIVNHNHWKNELPFQILISFQRNFIWPFYSSFQVHAYQIFYSTKRIRSFFSAQANFFDIMAPFHKPACNIKQYNIKAQELQKLKHSSVVGIRLWVVTLPWHSCHVKASLWYLLCIHRKFVMGSYSLRPALKTKQGTWIIKKQSQ